MSETEEIQEQMSIMSFIDTKFKYLSLHNIDLESRIIHFSSEITNKSANKLIKSLQFLESIKDEPIVIYINTPGGSIDAAFMIIDAIGTLDVDVVGVATGICMSAGVPLLASCDKRIATENVSFMTHSASYDAGFAKLADQDAALKAVKRLDNRVNKLLAAHTKKPYSFWASHKHVDFDFDAEQALSYGLVDEILLNAKKQ